MSKNIILQYNITNDPNLLDKQNAITAELSRILKRFHKLALGGKKSSVQKIIDAIEKYPENPQLKNYLFVLYGQIGDTEKAHETNRWITTEHPDYLFGKLNLANEYYYKEEYHKMPEILGDDMELKALYPNRQTFHVNEVTSFFKCAILYYTAIGDIEQAEIRLDIMQELAPDSADTKVAFNHLLLARMEASRKRYEEEERNRISVNTTKQEYKATYDAPKFENAEIEWLYTNGLYIGNEKLNTLLSLPKVSLISDLELVLQDSIERYAHFHNLVKAQKEWNEDERTFVIHAIYLLGELESTKSMAYIFNVLKQSDQYLNFYIGEFITSGIWEPIYKMANQNLDACKQFMFEPGVYTYARTVFTDMVEQVAHHQPDRRNEVIQWYRDVIHFFLNSKIEDNVIDSDVIGLIICNVLDIEAKELMPEIEMLFDKSIVSIGICGVWKDVKRDFEQPMSFDKTREIQTIFECYKEVTSSWENNNDTSFNKLNKFESLDKPIIAAPKIGRNEPCPCGSGKKHKKCCFNKLIS